MLKIIRNNINLGFLCLSFNTWAENNYYENKHLELFNIPTFDETIKIFNINKSSFDKTKLKLFVSYYSDEFNKKYINNKCDNLYKDNIDKLKQNFINHYECIFWYYEKKRHSYNNLLNLKAKSIEKAPVFEIENGSWEEINKSSPISSQNQSNNNHYLCAYKNNIKEHFGEIEEHLPNLAAWTQLNNFYHTESPCLANTNDDYEYLHYRMGLLNIMYGKLKQAEKSLTLALQAKKLTDGSRILFWLGFLFALSYENSDGSFKNHLNNHWITLQNKYFTSYHSLISFYLQNKHPFSLYNNRKFNIEWNEKTENNANMLIFAYLITRNSDNNNYIAKKISNIINSVYSRPFNANQGIILSIINLMTQNYEQSLKNIKMVNYLYPKEFKISNELIYLLYPTAYANIIMKEVGNLDPALILGLMREESAFNIKAKSYKNAIGLMQLLPQTASDLLNKKITEENLYDVNTNIKAGGLYLSQALNNYSGDFVFMLSSYNAGHGNVQKWRKRYRNDIPLLFADLIPFNETQKYVARVLNSAEWYRVILNTENIKKLNKAPLSYYLLRIIPKANQLARNEASAIQFLPIH